jgi:hypothetical protein
MQGDLRDAARWLETYGQCGFVIVGRVDEASVDVATLANAVTTSGPSRRMCRNQCDTAIGDHSCR